MTSPHQPWEPTSLKDKVIGGAIRWCLENKLVVFLLAFMLIGGGIYVAPFDWDIEGLDRSPVPVDAIPDIGENQQIVFTPWMGRSPQDVEDQITYPLTTALLGIPKVKTIRSYSMLGFSTIYVIFKEDAEFYWTRSRILEKLNSLPPGTLPENVSPALGPDATALGQVFWYTLEGRDAEGNPTGGWDLHELRTIQDWYVRYPLMSADGVSEVASIGGYVREYQIDVDPDAMHAHGISLDQVFQAVRSSNIDVGARTVEINSVEYVIRGIGFVKSPEDLRKAVIASRDDVPIYVENVAEVTLGPAMRRGGLDKAGAEAVGGVVVTRYGDNPQRVIQNIKKKIEEISSGLPRKLIISPETDPATAKRWALERGIAWDPVIGLDPDTFFGWQSEERSRLNDQDPPLPSWLTVSQVQVVPFYDRSELIHETLETLNEALTLEVLITIIVVILMVMHLRSSMLISAMLPLVILLTFISMRVVGVDANIVALSGIAIAIGTIVDMGIIVCENILKHLDEAAPGESRLDIIHRAATEVGSAVLTAIATTVVSFLPVFAMTGSEGKLFKPLAWTKTFALVSSVLLALALLPPLAHLLFRRVKPLKPTTMKWINGILVGAVLILLAFRWMPLGLDHSRLANVIFVAIIIGGLMSVMFLMIRIYVPVLRWCLRHKVLFLCVPLVITLMGSVIWVGFRGVFSFLPEGAMKYEPFVTLNHSFPGLGKEFMPPLDEGSFLYMPTMSTHGSVAEAIDGLRKQDMAIQAIPEIKSVVGKFGRAETPLDPAPVSMVETVIEYHSEYKSDEKGRILRFKADADGNFVRDDKGDLIEDSNGTPYRQWRDHIQSTDDIWDEIVKAAKVPGWTDAPKLQPIATRIVMLQSGMRAPMGIKVKGPDLATIEAFGLELEKMLKEVPNVRPETVVADRIVGKPYLHVTPRREAIARYGITIRHALQNVLEVAVGGKTLSYSVEGRERYPIRVRYPRELRLTIEDLKEIYVPAPNGAQVPLGQIADIDYIRGPQVIKGEDTALVGYVIFDKQKEVAEVDAVESVQRFLQSKIDAGDLVVPAGVSYTFAGTYENQIRATRKLMIVVPLSLVIIFLILYFQFRNPTTTMIIFTAIFVAWAGGFLMIWLYGLSNFLNFSILGENVRDLFQMHPINLSVAIWVGFLALFGIASDDGVVIATYLDQSFEENPTNTVEGIREATVQAGSRRIRPCLMTTATTILALLPILTSTGRGSDIMVPMAIPSFGGMAIELITLFVIPVLYCAMREFLLHTGWSRMKLDFTVFATFFAALGITLYFGGFSLMIFFVGFAVPLIYCLVRELKGRHLTDPAMSATEPQIPEEDSSPLD